MSIRATHKILRVYDPAECDEQGVPLDWERCRDDCGMGSLHEMLRQNGLTRPTCDGHGSLKAAALWAARLRARTNITNASEVCRCESCGHPMSEGTWEGGPIEDLTGFTLNEALRWEKQRGVVHYSPCDEGCTHEGGVGTRRVGTAMVVFDTNAWRTEASWRQVDVRALGWPHDLRPEKLAVLCLRCYARDDCGAVRSRRSITLPFDHGSAILGGMTTNDVIQKAARRAHVLFVHEGWEWADRGVPTVEMIEETYRTLVSMARKHKSASTGRLCVTDTDLGLALSVEMGSLFGDEDD